MGLVSPGSGVLAALDGVGRVWESLNNGLEWPVDPAAGRLGASDLAGSAEQRGTCASPRRRPLALHRRLIGQPTELDPPSAMARAKRLEEMVIGRARRLADRVRGGTPGAATLEQPSGKLYGWTPMTLPQAASAGSPTAIRCLAAHAGVLYAAVGGEGCGSAPTWVTPGRGFRLRARSLRSLTDATMAVGTGDGVDQRRQGSDLDRFQRGSRKRSPGASPGDQAGDPKVMLAGAAPAGAGDGPVADRRGLRFALYESKDAGKTWKHVTRGFPEVLDPTPSPTSAICPMTRTTPRSPSARARCGTPASMARGGSLWPAKSNRHACWA